MRYIEEVDLKLAFIKMMRKLQAGHTQVLKPFITALKVANNKERLYEVMALEEKIEKNAKQQQVLVNLMGAGYIEPEIYHTEKNDLMAEADSLMKEKQILSGLINDDLTHLEEAQKLLNFVSKKTVIKEFTDELFL